MLTTSDVRTLAEANSTTGPIVSCYLDVDGGDRVRTSDIRRAFEALVADTEAAEDVAGELDDVRERLEAGFDRSVVRGVAVFANRESDLFVVHQLPVPVRDELVVSADASIGQLELVLQKGRPLAVLAADRHHVRVFVLHQGVLAVEHEETAAPERDFDRTGEADRGELESHREELARQLLRRGVDALWTSFGERPFDHLVLATSDAVHHDVTEMLHPYLTERLQGRIALDPKASVADVRQAAMAAERDIARERGNAMVDRLLERLGTERAVAGLQEVGDALVARRVETLLVSDGYHEPGWRCPSCRAFATMGPTCACGATLTRVGDLVSAAVDEAVRQSVEVAVVDDAPDLDVAGRIGAILRY